MSRIATTFAALQAAGRKALIPYVTCGDPYADATVDIMLALARGGNPELAVYESYSGQLRLATSMEELVGLLVDELAQPAQARPLPAIAGMDVFQALPKIVDFYAQ